MRACRIILVEDGLDALCEGKRRFRFRCLRGWHLFFDRLLVGFGTRCPLLHLLLRLILIVERGLRVNNRSLEADAPADRQAEETKKDLFA